MATRTPSTFQSARIHSGSIRESIIEHCSNWQKGAEIADVKAKLLQSISTPRVADAAMKHRIDLHHCQKWDRERTVLAALEHVVEADVYLREFLRRVEEKRIKDRPKDSKTADESKSDVETLQRAPLSERCLRMLSYKLIDSLGREPRMAETTQSRKFDLGMESLKKHTDKAVMQRTRIVPARFKFNVMSTAWTLVTTAPVINSSANMCPYLSAELHWGEKRHSPLLLRLSSTARGKTITTSDVDPIIYRNLLAQIRHRQRCSLLSCVRTNSNVGERRPFACGR